MRDLMDSIELAGSASDGCYAEEGRDGKAGGKGKERDRGTEKEKEKENLGVFVTKHEVLMLRRTMGVC